MPAGALIQARINQETKDEATAVLASIGMTVSDAVRLMLTRVAQDKALPFDPLIPNEATVAAMREARAGINMRRVETVADLFSSLHGDDAED